MDDSVTTICHEKQVEVHMSWGSALVDVSERMKRKYRQSAYDYYVLPLWLLFAVAVVIFFICASLPPLQLSLGLFALIFIAIQMNFGVRYSG